jgi:DDE superfamily endonuclease
VSKPHPGARHDFSIFHENVRLYKDLLEKRPGEEALLDPAIEQTSWALLADKGYLGAEALLRAIIPKKALPNRRLSAEDLSWNQRLSSARVICENFYGRLKGLFAICTEKFRGLLLC